MAYGIYPAYPQATAPKKPAASDMFTQAAPNSPTAVAQGAQPSQATAATGAPPPSPFGAIAGATPFGPAATPGGFESLLNNAAPARVQNVRGAQKAISDMLLPSTEPSRESQASRSAFIKAQTEAGRENREASAGAGRLQTGQLGGDVARFNDKALGQRADLENQLAIQDGQRSDENRKAGISSFLQMEGLGEQARTSGAQLGLQERQLGENARQFETQQAFTEWATREGWNQDAIARAWQSQEAGAERKSREGIAFAGLSLQEKQLAQEAQQFTSRLDFDKWATQAGLDAQTAQRIWQSLESEKARTSTEKIAFAGLNLQEREMAQQAMQFTSKLDFDKSTLAANMDEAARSRVWQAVENEKSRTSTEKVAFAGLAQADRELAQQALQFGSKLDFDKSSLAAQMDDAQRQRIWQAVEAEKSRTSTEKIAFAGLSLQERELAQQSMQFGSKLDFDKWALEQGLQSEQAGRIWQAVENEKSRTSTEKIAFAGLSIQERELAQQGMQFDRKQDFDKWAIGKQLEESAAERIWKSIESEKARTFEGGESALDRALSASQFAERLGLDTKQLGEQIRQFNSREEFDRWAKGVDVDEAEKTRTWQAVQQDVEMKWKTGERLSSQDHEVLLEKMTEDNQMRVIERNQVLNLDTLEKQQAHDERILGLQNTYATIRQEQGFSHEAAMVQIEAEIAKSLSAQGYTQEQALQGARIEAQRIEGERSREMEERISFAQLASTSNIAMQELGIKREQLDLSRQELTADIQNNAELLGMKKDEFAAAMQDTRFARAMDTASVLMTKWGDNPDTQAKAAEILYGGLKEVGMISAEEYTMGVLSLKRAGFAGDDAAFKTWAAEHGYEATAVDKLVQAPAPGTGVASATVNGPTEASFDTGRSYLEGLNLSSAVNRASLEKAIAGIAASPTAGTAIAMKTLLNQHLTADQAYEFLVKSFGKEKVDSGPGSLVWAVAANTLTQDQYKKLTGLDWVKPY